MHKKTNSMLLNDNHYHIVHFYKEILLNIGIYLMIGFLLLCLSPLILVIQIKQRFIDYIFK